MRNDGYTLIRFIDHLKYDGRRPEDINPHRWAGMCAWYQKNYRDLDSILEEAFQRRGYKSKIWG